MQPEEMISVDDVCIHYNIERSFIYLLKESGLMTISMEEEKIFIPSDQLNNLEKIIRLYYDLGINLEGLETITYLLQRMNDMQQEINRLSNRLSVYENS
jgi:hypothetical protein